MTIKYSYNKLWYLQSFFALTISVHSKKCRFNTIRFLYNNSHYVLIHISNNMV